MRRTFRALRHRNFRLFWTGQLFSLIGTWMQSVAQQWLVYRLTGSPLALGSVTALQNLPVLLLSLFAGVLIDRVSKRQTILVTQLVAMLLAAVLAVLTFSELVRYWHVLLLATLLGIVNAIDMPARLSFVMEMVDGDRDDLLNAVALNSSIFNAARAIGPAVAGTLVGLTGEGWAFTINALSFLPVIVGLLMMRLPPFTAPPRRSTALGELAEGLRYVKDQPLIRALIIMVTIPSIFGIAFITLLPVLADQVLTVSSAGPLGQGAFRLGILMAAHGSGALLGALSIATFGQEQPRDRLLLFGGLGFSIGVLLLAFVSNFFVALPVLFLIGTSMITFLATSNALIQTATTDRLRGRVMSLYTMMLLGMAPIGSIFMGSIAQLTSAPLAIGLGGLICVVSTLIVITSTPALRLAAAAAEPATPRGVT